MAQLKLNPTEEVTETIRRMAARAGISVNAYLLPYINAVADGRLKMEPNFPAPTQAGRK